MDELHRGERSYKVQLMQRLLWKQQRLFGASQMPTLLGDFDDVTERALKAFQRQVHLLDTGVCEMATWRALGLAIEVRHRIDLVAQASDVSCWATAAGMILGFTPKPEPDFIGRLGGMKNSAEAVQKFADFVGWTAVNHSMTAEELIRLAQQTPVWVGLSGRRWAHAVIFSGVVGDGTPFGTGVTIHDPQPVNEGSKYATFLDRIELNGPPEDDPGALLYIIIPR